VAPRVKLLDGDGGAHVQHLLDLLFDEDFALPEQESAGALLYEKKVPPAYLAARDADRRNAEIYLVEAQRRLTAGDADGALRVLSSIVEEHPTRGDALRLVGYRLVDMKQSAAAVRLFDRVRQSRPFEPHSYLDLARSLEQDGKYGLAALQYEIVLAGTWHQRFHDSLKLVAAEEYARMMRQAVQQKGVPAELARHFGECLEKMDAKKFQSDLRVSISWNTDNTDVELWVTEPNREKCFYQHRQTTNGGELTEDVTQGYGPERYVAKKATSGEYVIAVHYFNHNPNLLAGETHVSVVVTRHAGTPEEVVERRTVILKEHDEHVEVCRVKF
jgi:tetratricopeptide (TPR) repeat protein